MRTYKHAMILLVVLSFLLLTVSALGVPPKVVEIIPENGAQKVSV